MKRLLIVAPNWLGDAVMALPAVADLRRGLPEAFIAVAARRSVGPLFTLVRDVDDVVSIDERKAYAVSGFDAALLLPNSFHAALTLARAGVPERWGYRTEWRGFLLTRAVERAASVVHQVDSYQQLVRALNFPNGPAVPRLEAPPALRAAGARLLRDTGWDERAPLVALAPGAAFGSSKRWPPASFAGLAADLAADAVATVLIGAASDAGPASDVMRALPDRRRGTMPLLNLVGKTDVPTLAGVLANCRAMVANDSGPLHLAAALGVPVTAVFGPTDERLTAPRGESRSGRSVITHSVWCRPCMLRECPLDHACMRGVRVATVLDSARRML